MSARILVVDDDKALGTALLQLLGHVGYAVRHALNADEALEMVRADPTDLVLLDLRLGSQSGLTLLPRLKALRPEMAVIVITALASVDTVVEAMKQGADNFVVKPVDPPRLIALVGKGLEAVELRRKNLQLGRLSGGATPAPFVEAEDMKDALQLVEAVAARNTTVLLLGETGTGKGIMARHLHGLSPRAALPFVELNCAGLERELTESELFGYERGAFTGAVGRKVGLFDAADGGTLFLDEIGELDLMVQAKLLKVLEDRRFRRIGGVAEIEVDVRVVAATHRDLETAVKEGRFRADLLYRLNVFAVRIPALRERREEVLPLARRFLAEASRGHAPPELSPEAARLLENYGWPGNVRELRNVIERAAILCPPGAAIAPNHLPPLPGMTGAGAAPATGGGTLEEMERHFLERSLAANGGNIQATAKAMGVSRGTLYRKISKYKLATAD